MVLIVVGLVFICLIIFNSYYDRQMESWEIVKGTVLQTNLSKRVDYSSIDEFGPTRDITYTFNINYEYVFKGIRYTSSKIFYFNFNNWFMFNKYKIRLNDTYASTSVVDFYVNSKHPERGFLKRGAPWRMKLLFAVACFTFDIIFLIS